VQVGTANFVDPLIWPKLLDGIRDYMQRHRIERITDLVGTIRGQHAVAGRTDG
jgi:dihydroorotate dehydrogenase (NAD+) catalytic subunit